MMVPVSTDPVDVSVAVEAPRRPAVTIGGRDISQDVDAVAVQSGAEGTFVQLYLRPGRISVTGSAPVTEHVARTTGAGQAAAWLAGQDHERLFERAWEAAAGGGMGANPMQALLDVLLADASREAAGGDPL